MDNELVCSECFLVMEEMVLEHPLLEARERYGYDTEHPHAQHVGPLQSVNLKDCLRTLLWNESRDSRGRKLSVSKRQHIFRLVQANRQTKRDIGDLRLFYTVKGICSRLQVPRAIQNRAIYLARKARGTHVFQGRGFNLLASGAVYLALREAHIPMDASKIAEAIDPPATRKPEKSVRGKTAVLKAYMKLRRGLKIHIDPITTEALFPFIANLLSLTPEERTVVQRALRSIKRPKNPRADIAAVIYYTTGRVQKEVAPACSTTEVTLRSRLRAIKDDIEEYRYRPENP